MNTDELSWLHYFQAHTLFEFPNEACGLVVNGEYIPCTNVAQNPSRAFQISTADQLKALQVGPIQFICHSHPYDINERQTTNPIWPSKSDQEGWLSDNIPWVIVATDGEAVSEPLIMDDSNPEPVEGRSFIWGYQDCYSLVRDYYREKMGITLKNYARDWGFWEKGESMFVDLFENTGFTAIDPAKADVGDLVLLRVHSQVPNHIGVITGTNEFLHQVPGHFSKYSEFGIWQKSVTHVLHYIGMTNETTTPAREPAAVS